MGGGGHQARNNPIPNENANPNPNSNPNSPHGGTRGSKGKSCKGCAYYSSVHKAKSKNPTCVGFSRTLRQGDIELELLEDSKESRSLNHVKYACIGYSVYFDNKDSSADPKDKTAKLPLCFGLEVVLEEKSSTSPAGHVPTPAHKIKEHEQAAPQPRRFNNNKNNNKPPNIKAEEFLNRFQKNAGLVASGVVKNLNRVGNYVKETLDDILYRRPK